MIIRALCFYFVPFVICVLCAKYTEDEDYLLFGYFPIINWVIAAIGIIFVSYDLLFKWIRK